MYSFSSIIVVVVVIGMLLITNVFSLSSNNSQPGCMTNCFYLEDEACVAVDVLSHNLHFSSERGHCIVPIHKFMKEGTDDEKVAEESLDESPDDVDDDNQSTSHDESGVESNSDMECDQSEDSPSGPSDGSSGDSDDEDSSNSDKFHLFKFARRTGERCFHKNPTNCRYHDSDTGRHRWFDDQRLKDLVGDIPLEDGIDPMNGSPSDIPQNDWEPFDYVEYVLCNEFWSNCTRWTNEHIANDPDAMFEQLEDNEASWSILRSFFVITERCRKRNVPYH